MVSSHRACVLQGPSPPNFVSYFPYQTFLQTQRNRRMTSSVRAAGKAGRRRGTRAREGQSRYLLKKRRHTLLQEMSPVQAPAHTPAAIEPKVPVFSPLPSSASSTSSSNVCSSLSPSSPPPTTWQLSPLSDVSAGFEPSITALSETETDSPPPTTTKTTAGSAESKKKYPCDLCDKSFDYKHVLQNHNRTHTGEKPYQCPQCHKRFTRDHHLKTHIRLHTGEKPFGCAVCHKRFVQVANLRRHERVHAGEQLHRCGHDHCDATSSDCDRPTTPVNPEPFDCAARGVQSRRKRHRVKSGPVIRFATLRPDESSMNSSIAATTFSIGGTLVSGVPAPVAANANTMNSSVGLDLLPFFNGQAERDDGNKPPIDGLAASRDGCLTMDVGFRVVRNNRYQQRQLGRRFEAWPHLHRLSQPCQEQPEDLSVKK